ncbi:MAG: hypothetical protein WCE54_12280 [Ignavibacteriaceae bacterium]
MIDMAYLVSHNQIRLPKVYYEEGIYLPYFNNNEIDKYTLTKDKIIKEDENHYFFAFPFSADKVENAAV